MICTNGDVDDDNDDEELQQDGQARQPCRVWPPAVVHGTNA